MERMDPGVHINKNWTGHTTLMPSSGKDTAGDRSVCNRLRSSVLSPVLVFAGLCCAVLRGGERLNKLVSKASSVVGPELDSWSQGG